LFVVQGLFAVPKKRGAEFIPVDSGPGVHTRFLWSWYSHRNYSFVKISRPDAIVPFGGKITREVYLNIQ
jgi:hypothetical protein